MISCPICKLLEGYSIHMWISEKLILIFGILNFIVLQAVMHFAISKSTMKIAPSLLLTLMFAMLLDLEWEYQ